MRTRVFVAITVVSSIAATLFVANQISAAPLAAGTAVTVYIAANGNQPEPDPGPPTDKLVFTGQKVVDSSLPGCTETALPLQSAVLVDPGTGTGGRSGRIIAVFSNVVGMSDGLPPGTRLGSFAGAGTCISGGDSYRKYTTVTE